LLLAHSTALAHGVGRAAALTAAQAALEVAAGAGHVQRQGRALARIARVHAGYGEAELAAEIASQALDAARQSGDTLGEAYACSTIAAALRQLGKLEQARGEIVQALGLLRTVRRPRLELESLELLAAIERAQGRTERALAVLEDALEACKRIGDERMLANVSCELGVLHEQLAEPERARGDYERAMVALAHLGCRHEELGARLSAAAVRLELNDGGLVAELLDESLALARQLGDRQSETLAAALLGVAEARADRFGHAERAFELAASLADGAGGGLQDAVALHRGHYQLALARRAEQDGAPQEAARIRSTLRAELVPRADWSDRVRQAARLLERSLESTRPARLSISPDGSSFQAPGSPPVSLSNRRTLCRLLALLADRRAEQPGVPLGYGPIAEALWPGERIIASAAKSRIHVAISTLRKLGLGDFVRGGAQGYYLDPSVELSRELISRI
jgi:tetratricopeptide (TPR) repeat protein